MAKKKSTQTDKSKSASSIKSSIRITKKNEPSKKNC